MQKRLLALILIFPCFSAYSQVIVQSERYEMEKKNTDDFFTVASAGALGLVIIRDTNEEFSFTKKVDGDTWQITALDTALLQTWQHDLSIDYEYLFKAYELVDGVLYLLYRDGQFEKNDYHLITIDIASGDIGRHDIKNEIELDLSHITVVADVVVLGGYVRYSPTLVKYRIGDDKLEIIPGFFKDRSDVIGLRNNKNGTFNALTLEKGYEGFFIRLRTHSKDGNILFERQVNLKEDYRVLSGKSTGFVNGNIAITGSYGARGSFYSQGIYFAIVKPEGQKNIINYIDFTEMDHFFDYMRTKRAERIKRKIKRKIAAGKEYKYSSRILLHEVTPTEEGFLLSAEVYDPRYDRMNTNDYERSYFNQSSNETFTGANFNYVKQPNRLVHVDDANHFKYLESIILTLNKDGDLDWDESFKINEVESAALDPVVDLSLESEDVLMLYRNEENISYKRFYKRDSALQAEEPIKLEFEDDEIRHNYNLVGGTKHWYNNNFFVWGYHKVENKGNPAIDKRRTVLFINKVQFE